jgi:hypothetical protein
MSEANLTSRGMSGHQRAYRGDSDTWLTPPGILEALGPFDTDPCCPPSMPWGTATVMVTPEQDGLQHSWVGRVWLNPPYGPETDAWLEKLAEHGNGTALIFARTETRAWHKHVWPKATAILFLEGRLHFHDIEGVRAKANAGAPSALVAYGVADALRLAASSLPGKFVPLF